MFKIVRLYISYLKKRLERSIIVYYSRKGGGYQKGDFNNHLLYSADNLKSKQELVTFSPKKSREQDKNRLTHRMAEGMRE